VDKSVNLVKLCVGADEVQDLIDWQAERRRKNGGAAPFHVTRMFPKRSAELLNGGSLYWVFKGVMAARQRILALEEVRGEDGILRCKIVLDAKIIRTEPVPRRPFQGWRYLEARESPRDLTRAGGAEAGLPPSLIAALSEIGVR